MLLCEKNYLNDRVKDLAGDTLVEGTNFYFTIIFCMVVVAVGMVVGIEVVVVGRY